MTALKLRMSVNISVELDLLNLINDNRVDEDDIVNIIETNDVVALREFLQHISIPAVTFRSEIDSHIDDLDPSKRCAEIIHENQIIKSNI